MEAITDPAVVAWRLRDVAYLHLSMLALLVHDWLILLEREVEDIWQSESSFIKVLFFITRYGPFFDMPITITTHTAPYGAISYDTCNTLYKIATWNTFLGVTISESILLLRTNAIYSRSKRVMIPLSIVYAIAAVTGIVITWRYLSSTLFGPPPNNFFKGCYLVQRNPIIFFNFLLLLVIELAVVILTVRRGFGDFFSGTPLLRVVYRDSVAFFLVLFSLTLSAILVLALAPPEYNGLMAASARVVHSIVCCRILLNLRRAASTRGTIATEMTTGLAFATSPAQQTNQVESVGFEAHGMESDEESSRRRADGDFVADSVGEISTVRRS